MQFMQEPKPTILAQVKLVHVKVEVVSNPQTCGIFFLAHLSASVTNPCVHVFFLTPPNPLVPAP